MHLIYSLSLAAVAQAAVVRSAPVEDAFQPDSTTLSRRNPPVCVTSPAFPTPPKAHCGAAGKLTTRDVLFKTTISDPNPLQACRDQCMANSACLSFAWKALTQSCRGFGSTLNQQGLQLGPSNGNVFYSRGCFTTTCSAAACVSARLASPTAITDYGGGTSYQGYPSGTTFQVPLPFPIGYGVYAKSLALISVDGYLHTGETSTPYLSWAPFYAPAGPFGLQIVQGQDEGLFFDVEGTAPNRIVKFEWRTTSNQKPQERYDTVLQLYEANPTAATYSYLQITDDGSIGYSYIKDSVLGTTIYSNGVPTMTHTGLTLDLQTNTQTFTVDTRPICDP